MCTTAMDGVLIVHEGARRLRWAHELEGSPPPLHAHQWQIGALWPDDDARRHIRERLDRGEPVLVILDPESPRVELPVEHVPHIPAGVVAEEDLADGVVTLEVPVLDWLEPAERARGLAFAADVRRTLEKTPRFLLPPVIVESASIGSGAPLVFAHPTGPGTLRSSVLTEVVRSFTDGSGAHGHPAVEPSAPDWAPSGSRSLEALPLQRSGPDTVTDRGRHSRAAEPVLG